MKFVQEKTQKKFNKKRKRSPSSDPEDRGYDGHESSSKSDSERALDGNDATPSTSSKKAFNNCMKTKLTKTDDNINNLNRVSKTNNNDKAEVTNGTNANCDKSSNELSTSSRATSSNISKPNDVGDIIDRKKVTKVWAQPRTPTLRKHKDLTITNEDQQEHVTKRLKPRLAPISISSSVADQPNLDGSESIEKITIDFPLSRERIESLTVIDKDELNKYLTEDLTQEESNPAEDEEEMITIFQKQPNSSNNNNYNNNGIPYLDNYMLCAKNGQDADQSKPKCIDGQQLSALRNMIAQNIPSARSELPRPASSALAMIAHQSQIANNPIRAKPHDPNQTFVPISRTALGNAQSVGASPFVSPRSTPIPRNRKPNLPPLQMQGHQHNNQHNAYVKQEPVSAPNSPSVSQPFRYYPHVINPAPQMFTQEIFNRSASVPIPNYPTASSGYVDSTYTSVNPTPVPSECNDFNDASNLLEMFSENGTMPTVKNEFFLEDDDMSSSIGVSDVLDETNAKIPNASIVSRSVPSTPLPTSYASMGLTPTKCNSKYDSEGTNFDMSKSVPNTPVNSGCIESFRYTPPTSRDYLINGYAHEQITESEKSQDGFNTSGYMVQQSDRFESNDDTLIESNIFD